MLVHSEVSSRWLADDVLWLGVGRDPSTCPPKLYGLCGGLDHITYQRTLGMILLWILAILKTKKLLIQSI